MEAAELERITSESDALVVAARDRLVGAVRLAYAEGMSQREIARHSNRSQAEISRLLRFHGTTPRARRLRAKRGELLELLRSHGLTKVRVFGSVAMGTDHEGSDIDLLVAAGRPLGRLPRVIAEAEAAKLIGLPVVLVVEEGIREDLRDHILATAVSL